MLKYDDTYGQSPIFSIFSKKKLLSLILQIWLLLWLLDTLSPVWSQTFTNPNNLTNDLLILNFLIQNSSLLNK